VKDIDSDLHVHLLQSLYPEDVYDLARPVMAEIDWNRFDFLNRYEKIIGVRLDPNRILSQESRRVAITELAAAMVFSDNEAGDFDKFDIRTFLPQCVTGYYMDRGLHSKVVDAVVRRHKQDGVRYAEYRQGIGYSDEDKPEWKDWNYRIMYALKHASSEDFQARYIMRISDNMYDAVREFIRENPDVSDILVGIDFTGKEIPVKAHKALFDKIRVDNQSHPSEALDVVVHVGEVYYDKSLEGAIRWCHEYAEAGVKRLGHCVALGLDAKMALSRAVGAHETESVSERLDQIAYDIRYCRQLRDRGVIVDEQKLTRECSELQQLDPRGLVSRWYDENRVDEIRIRQDFVLDTIREMGIVIEVCPTSNRLIAGVRSTEAHPFKRFFESGQKLAICTDDPGTLMVTLSDEVRVVTETLHISTDQLSEQIGNPYDHRLGVHRTG
jgi:hypothetical protein